MYDPCSPLNTITRDLALLHKIIPRHKPVKATPEQPPRSVKPVFSHISDADGVRLEIELPGVAKENVEIEIKDSNLIVLGERFDHERMLSGSQVNDALESIEQNEDTTGEEKGKVTRDGSPTTSYELKLKLGDRVDQKSIKAESYSDGVLSLGIPFKKVEKRIIQVS